MNEPIQTPEPMFFEIENLERSVGLKKFSHEWKDILDQLDAEGKSLDDWAQENYPVPTEENEPQNALASWMQLSNVVTNDNKALGIKSTPMKEISKSPWKKAIFIAGLKKSVSDNLQGYLDDPVIQTLAGPAATSDYAQGTSVHPRMYLPLRDSSRLTAFPPLSAIASQVTLQNGQIFIPEFKANEETGPGPHPWVDGDTINLDTARISERATTPKSVAGGFRVSDGLWQSPVGASFVQIQADRYRVRVERMLVKEILGKVGPALTAAKTKDIGLDGDEYPASVLTKIAMLYTEEEEDWMVTTLLGLTDTVEKYLDIDRSGHFTNSGMRNVQGNVAGWDTYGKMPSDRMVYNIRANQISGHTLAENTLVAIDAMDTASVYIMEDTSRESAADLERSTNFSYTLKFVTTLNQEDGEPIRLLT